MLPLKFTASPIRSGHVKMSRSKSHETWYTVPRFPTEIHLEMLRYQIIDDPFQDLNEVKCSWIHKSQWTYRATIPSLSTSFTAPVKAVLNFQGLDTYVTVHLNNQKILLSDNMFHQHRVNVTSLILNPLASSPSKNSMHQLMLNFDSAFLRAASIKEKLPTHVWVGWNGDMARLAARKAQFHWGWDWGPILSPCGPWRPIHLEVYSVSIQEPLIKYTINQSKNILTGSLRLRLDAAPNFNFKCILKLNIRLRNDIVFHDQSPVNFPSPSKDQDPELSSFFTFTIANPCLWYPRNYGPQSLYNVEISICLADDETTILHQVSNLVGFRYVELVQKNDAKTANRFYFRINGIPVFAGGSNWIPADSFVTRISPAKYHRLIQSVAKGNQSMIRVWGGGIYESEEFYKACDEFGILVWQDFMFACGSYPAHPGFLASVRKEAVQTVQRLHWHPCIVLYAGNNEDYQICEQFHLTYVYEDKIPENWLKTSFPARYIYEHLLPQICDELGNQVPYHPGSPWSKDRPTRDPSVGDVHEWNVWHGDERPYQEYSSLGGLFISEFGMQAFPYMETIQSFCSDKSQLNLHSSQLQFHNKGSGAQRRLEKYTSSNFGETSSLDKFIYYSQMCQSEAVNFALRSWRKIWGEDHRCGGALIWQLNDCWPCISWSMIDYFERKKPSYYTTRRRLATLSIAVVRQQDNEKGKFQGASTERNFDVWVSSSYVHNPNQLYTIEIRIISVASGRDTQPMQLIKDVKLIPNGITPVHEGLVNDQNLVAVRMIQDDETVSRDWDWPQPLKNLDFSNRGLKINAKNERTFQDSSIMINIVTERPVKGLVFTELDGVEFEDNGFDVMPGETREIRISKLDKEDGVETHMQESLEKHLQWRYMGQSSREFLKQ